MKVLKKSTKQISRFLEAIIWCLSLSWKSSKGYTVLRIAGEVFSPLLVIVISFIGKYVIDLLSDASENENSKNLLFSLLCALLIVSLLRFTVQRINQYCQAMHDDVLSKKISLMMMERSLSVDLEFYDNPEFQDKLQNANQDSHTIVSIVWNVVSCVSTVVTFVSVFVILLQVNLFYGLLMAAASVPSSIAAAKYTKLLYRLNLEQINEQRKMYYCQSVASSRQYAQDIRLFNAGGLLKQRYERLWASLFSVRRAMMKKRAKLTALLEYMPEILSALIGMNIAFNTLSGISTVGDYSLYTGLLGQLWTSISLLSMSIVQIYDNQLKIENIKKLDGFKNRVEDKGETGLTSVNSIEFDGVCFSYPGTAAKALDSVTFRLDKREKVAFVGLNGSGKSTLIKLLLRMYDPESGSIYINGKDIKEYRLSDLRSNFSVYFQEMSNYCFSIKENFTVADSNRENADETAESALKLACLDDILDKAPKRLDTSLTRFFETDGIELSGGQHQKLALARAFFRRHTALILDEPSSNLDPKAEHQIFQSLKSFTDGKMTIFTSHRLSNVSLANRIIVLENGRVIEDGTQEELLRNNNRYAELFRYQQEKYMGSNANYVNSSY